MHSSDFRATKNECEFALLGLKGLIGFLVCFNIYLGIVHLFLNYTLIIYDRFDLITFIGCVHNIGQLVFLGGMGVATSS